MANNDEITGGPSVTTGLAKSLLEYSLDIGPETSMKQAEEWRNALEAMAECANDEQRAAIRLLMGPLEMHISIVRLAEIIVPNRRNQ